MTEDMRGKFSPDTCLQSVSSQDLPEALTRHLGAALCDKETVTRLLAQQQRPAARNVPFDFSHRFLPDGNNPLLVAFPNTRKNSQGMIQLHNGQGHQLAYSQARGI